MKATQFLYAPLELQVSINIYCNKNYKKNYKVNTIIIFTFLNKPHILFPSSICFGTLQTSSKPLKDDYIFNSCSIPTDIPDDMDFIGTTLGLPSWACWHNKNGLSNKKYIFSMLVGLKLSLTQTSLVGNSLQHWLYTSPPPPPYIKEWPHQVTVGITSLIRA